jgi:hypothetical protein
MDKKKYNYCFTLNNYTTEDLAQVDEFPCSYMLYAPEEGDNGTPHLQGYFEMTTQRTMKSICKKDLTRASLREAHGSAEHNLAYIQGPYSGIDHETKQVKTKPFNPLTVIRGTPKLQGKRTDLNAVKDEILNGKKVDDIVLESPMIYHQYGRTLREIEQIKSRKAWRNFTTKGIWIHGPTETGKSFYWEQDFDPERMYIWKFDNGWNDDYESQEIVVIDEFRGELPYADLLKMISGTPNYPVRRRNKPTVPFMSKFVIITSSLSPAEVYFNLQTNDSLEQLERRCRIVKTEKGKQFNERI